MARRQRPPISLETIEYRPRDSHYSEEEIAALQSVVAYIDQRVAEKLAREAIIKLKPSDDQPDRANATGG